MSLDEAGELLHEARFFVDRPTERDVLDMLENAVNGGKKIYALHEAADMAKRDTRFDDEEWLYRVGELERELDFKRDDDADLFDEVLEAQMEGAEPWVALQEAVTARRQSVLDRWADEGGDVGNDWRAEHDHTGPSRADEDAGGEAGGGPDSAGAPARGSGAAGEAGREAGEPSALSARAFDDPDAEAARAQVESLEHDLRMAVDPAIAERQRQQAALKAASPLQATTDQEGTIGLGLFDATDQYRLDVDAGDHPPTDLLGGLDDEQAAIEAVRKCL